MGLLKNLLNKGPVSGDPNGSHRKNNKPTHENTLKSFEGEMPDTAFMQARNQYFDSVGQPVVDKSRLFVICLGLMTMVILLIILFIYLLPLKTTEPYVVYVDVTKGIVTKDVGNISKASEYNPERPVLERELFQFVEKMYAINSEYPRIIKEGHTQAFAYTRGTAIEDFRSFINVEQPYQRQRTTNGLFRSIEKKTISFREDGKLVLVRFKTNEKTTDRPVPVGRDWLITLQFERKQPIARAELESNPLGIYVTHFEIIEER